MARASGVATLGLAIIGFGIVWGLMAVGYLLTTGVPRGDRFNPDDREWWAIPMAAVGLALVAYDVWRGRETR